MDWVDVSEELPAPHGDEQASLRQDIADELGDHLQCALRRESLSSSDENAARASVLKQFGDPRRIARRLWLDAMRERIMSQRITLALAALVTIVCLLALGIVWKIAEDSRAANLALVEDARATNQALLSQLGVLAERIDAEPENLDWSETKVRVVLGEPGGKPVENCKVQISSRDNSLDRVWFNETTNADGIADFGPLRVAGYQVNIVTPWGDSKTEQIYLRARRNEAYEWVCFPPREPAKLSFDVAWPDDLGGRYSLLATIRRDSSGENGWEVANAKWSLLITHDNDLYSVYTDHEGNRVRVNVNQSLGATMEVPEGTYRIYDVHVVESVDMTQSLPSELHFELLVSTILGDVRSKSLLGRRPSREGFVEPSKVATPWTGALEIKSGQDNRWQLSIPDWVVSELRRYGTSEPEPHDESNGEASK